MDLSLTVRGSTVHCFSQVQGILVNIFGGIVDCTTIANGIVEACREIQLQLPLVVRLEGTCRCACIMCV